MSLDDLILQTLLPTSHDLGGFKVHRTLPHKERTTVGPFIFFDQMGPAHLPENGGIDVRPHPHINLATVTYLFAGAIDHRDSLGTYRTIEPGAVNLMTAGRGISHSERSPAALRPAGPELSGIQTWLALPSAKEEMDPAFEHVPKAALPVVDGAGAAARVVMGSLWGATSPVTCHSETIYADVHLLAGGSMPIDPEADERALYVAEGEASLDGLTLAPQSLYVLRPGTRATLRSNSGAHVMLCGGAPLDGPRHVWWNFVSSRRDRIREARQDWKAGRFALPPDDHDEFIPLPEVPKTVSYP
ncbi:pirin family protein [Sphingosinicella sp. BN140058]|uniref:pirin family protein n=1 Tax=Sphingosinicella sp. BN140058 TaxID=1892855 RepID=UPI001013B2EE|nr:pirin family protein [Sphingosinicella sp. BN140058]QAY77077.1 pirin family protein [Sphingosinicella sp. BN140058]